MDEGWKWFWGAGSEPDVYHPAESRDDAIAQAQDDAENSGCEVATICEGKRKQLTDKVFDADHVLEWWQDHNEECQDEDGELKMNPTADQKTELEMVLNAALATWRAKHDLGHSWSLDTRNEEVIRMEQAKDA